MVTKRWATFEERVRTIASHIWSKQCSPMRIGGVDIDGVMKLDEDLYVFIEITERRELSKVREDVVKLQTAKAALLSETGAFPRCYCVINGSVTDAMIEAGKPHQIRVLSLDNFASIFFDFPAYKAAREAPHSAARSIRLPANETKDHTFRLNTSSMGLQTM